jgi:hypothetical protein
MMNYPHFVQEVVNYFVLVVEFLQLVEVVVELPQM